MELNRVVLSALRLDYELCLPQALEDLLVPEFNAQLAVRAILAEGDLVYVGSLPFLTPSAVTSVSRRQHTPDLVGARSFPSPFTR